MRFPGVLLDKNLSFKWHVQIIRVKNFLWTWNHSKIKALFSFFYPPSFILLSHLPLYILLFVCMDVDISFGTCSYSPSFMRKRQEFSSRLHTLIVNLLKVKDIYCFISIFVGISMLPGRSPMLFFGTAQTSRGSIFIYRSKLGGCDDSS